MSHSWNAEQFQSQLESLTPDLYSRVLANLADYCRNGHPRYAGSPSHYTPCYAIYWFLPKSGDMNTGLIYILLPYVYGTGPTRFCLSFYYLVAS
ncbi:Uncharacterised protein [Budvicia aquatica]|uniref:Uncharacterized protein n=1 Tax=Budvicia aquatica TaxID=82979 RepID=A0A484ZQD6_9GAMM|nr:Uncharacterised protein [Budvicia aquatica]